MSDEIYNAAEPTSVRRAAKASRQADRNRQDIVKGIMSLLPGRAWMFQLLETCGVFRSSFASDSLAMAFKEGERNIGLQLLSQITAACPEQFILMMRESNERNNPGNAGTDRNGTSYADGSDSGASPDYRDDAADAGEPADPGDPA